MPGVVFNLDAETGKAVSGFLKIVDAQRKAEDGNRKVKDSGNEMLNALDKGFEKVKASPQEYAKSLIAMGTSFFAVEKIADKAFEAINTQIERSKEKARSLNTEIKNIAQALSEAGQVKDLTGARAALDKIQSKTLNKEQIASLFTTITRAGGDETSPAQKLIATRAAVNASAAGLNPEEFGKTYIELSKNAFKNTSEKDLTNITTNFIQGGGKLDESGVRLLNQATALGRDPKEVLRLFSAAGKRGESGKALKQLQDLSMEEIDTSFLDKSVKLGESSDENKARVAKLQEEREQLDKNRRQEERRFQDERAAMRNPGKGHLREFEDRERKAQRSYEDQRAAIGDQLERYDKVMVKPELDAEQKRKVALAAIPAEERIFKILENPELAPAKLRPAIANLRAGLESGEGGGLDMARKDYQQAVGPAVLESQAREVRDADRRLSNREVEQRKQNVIGLETDFITEKFGINSPTGRGVVDSVLQFYHAPLVQQALKLDPRFSMQQGKIEAFEEMVLPTPVESNSKESFDELVSHMEEINKKTPSPIPNPARNRGNIEELGARR